MGILNDTYMPEPELFGDKFEIRTEQYPFYTDTQTMQRITPDWTALDSVVGASPKSKSCCNEKAKVLKLISAIILTSVNVNDWTLTEDAKSLIEKVICTIYPADSVEFGICHHWGRLSWNVTGVFGDKSVIICSIQQRTPKMPPFARNKGNKDTCMRKVQRMRKFAETIQDQTVY